MRRRLRARARVRQWRRQSRPQRASRAHLFCPCKRPQRFVRQRRGSGHALRKRLAGGQAGGNEVEAGRRQQGGGVTGPAADVQYLRGGRGVYGDARREGWRAAGAHVEIQQLGAQLGAEAGIAALQAPRVHLPLHPQ